MTIKKFFIAACLVLIGNIIALGQSNTQVSISGNIANNKFASTSLYHISKEQKLITTVPITKGEFALKINITKPDFYKLLFDNNNFVMLILYPGENISISTDANNFFDKLTIKGSPHSEFVYKNQKLITTTKNKMDSIINLSYAAMSKPKSDSLQKIYNDEYELAKKNQETHLRNFVKNNPGSLAVLFLTETLPVDEHTDVYSFADSALTALYPDNFYVNNFHLQLEASKKTAIGSIAPDFTLPDTNGVNISLSSLRGKYVLVDFWASWCGPCKKEIPNLIRLYNDFKGKNFEIFGVSLDKTRSAWVAAIRNEKLTWIHVSDLKFWQSAVVPIYNITGIPFMILLDPEGKIIAKNLRGEQLYKKVESLLKQ